MGTSQAQGTTPLNFLYLGKDQAKLRSLMAMLRRNSIRLDQTDSPEAAYFEIIRGEVQALFVDLSDPGLNVGELISGFQSIGNDVEVVLIATPERFDNVSQDLLRFCYGYMTPQVESPGNLMVLGQLTEKVTTKMRLERLRNTSIIDGLTQLHNHAYFQQHLEREIEESRKEKAILSLVMFDIDHFKNYNDTNGHPAGDKVLKKIARLLDESVRKFDFTARYGGEEFAIVFPTAGLRTALMATERYRRKVEATDFEFGFKQPLGFVSASFGVAQLDHRHIADKQTLISVADQALYRAKESKRNCIWYHHDGQFSQYQPSLLA